jgi:hypothetical protein
MDKHGQTNDSDISLLVTNLSGGVAGSQTYDSGVKPRITGVAGRAEGSNYDVISGQAGTVNSKMAPWGTFAFAHNRPPCASMIERQMGSPIPKPFGLVV